MALESSVSSRTVDALPPPPADGRGVCDWARGARERGMAREAVELWTAKGKPGEALAPVCVALALLEAEAGRWAEAGAHSARALENSRQNPLAGGVAALAAFHSGDSKRAAELFKEHGLFAARPLIKLFVRSFAEPMRLNPAEFPLPGAVYPAGGGKADSGASAQPGGLAQLGLSAQPGSSVQPAASAQPGPAAGGAAGNCASAPPVPGLLKSFIQGGGFGPSARARAWLAEGDRLLARGRLAEALAHFQAAAREDDQFWLGGLASGLCQIELGEFQAASETLVDLLGRFPDAPPVVSASAWALYHVGEPRKALDLLATLQPAGPDDWCIHYVAAACFLSLGKEKEANAMLDQALGPFFLDTWEQFIQPMFRRVMRKLSN